MYLRAYVHQLSLTVMLTRSSLQMNASIFYPWSVDISHILVRCSSLSPPLWPWPPPPRLTSPTRETSSRSSDRTSTTTTTTPTSSRKYHWLMISHFSSVWSLWLGWRRYLALWRLLDELLMCLKGKKLRVFKVNQNMIIEELFPASCEELAYEVL